MSHSVCLGLPSLCHVAGSYVQDLSLGTSSSVSPSSPRQLQTTLPWAHADLWVCTSSLRGGRTGHNRGIPIQASVRKPGIQKPWLSLQAGRNTSQRKALFSGLMYSHWRGFLHVKGITAKRFRIWATGKIIPIWIGNFKCAIHFTLVPTSMFDYKPIRRGVGFLYRFANHHRSITLAPPVFHYKCIIKNKHISPLGKSFKLSDPPRFHL